MQQGSQHVERPHMVVFTTAWAGFACGMAGGVVQQLPLPHWLHPAALPVPRVCGGMAAADPAAHVLR